mgnify:CR=1 FL=1|tara:strand:- start:1201 stop:1422 length:222 start_codon:yes stop_codon:yes gene_type:complete
MSNKLIYSRTKTKDQPYRLSWEKFGTAEQFIEELDEIMIPVIETIRELDGDMYLSDYRKLIDCYWMIKNRGDK